MGVFVVTTWKFLYKETFWYICHSDCFCSRTPPASILNNLLCYWDSLLQLISAGKHWARKHLTSWKGKMLCEMVRIVKEISSSYQLHRWLSVATKWSYSICFINTYQLSISLLETGYILKRGLVVSLHPITFDLWGNSRDWGAGPVWNSLGLLNRIAASDFQQILLWSLLYASNSS